MTRSTRLLCSTGAFSRYPDHTGYQAVLKYGPQLDVDGFELMFYPRWYENIERIADDLQQSGLRFPAMHTEKNIGTYLGQPDATERERGVHFLAENMRLASLIGARILVLHLWNWPELDNNLELNLSVLSQCYDNAEHYGIELAIETIPGRHFDPLNNIYRALECDTRCRFALDTEFLANYQQLEAVFEAKWLWNEDRVHHVHIKDSIGQPFIDGVRRYLHPGEGHIDFTQFFTHLKEKEFHGNLSLESPAITLDGEVHIKQLRESLDYIRQYGYPH